MLRPTQHFDGWSNSSCNLRTFGIDRNKLEKLIHKFFSNARLKIEIKDRFGRPYVPLEWFCVPLSCIEEAVECIKNGSLSIMCMIQKMLNLLKRAELFYIK